MFSNTASRFLKTHHYCILRFWSTFVIYVVLYPYHMMYSNIVKELVFQYIEHSILRYDFLYDIDMYLFQLLPLLPWTSDFSKIMIIMYFGHRFPLTSHIGGNLLSAKMALLYPSANIPHVGTQKDKLGLKWPKHYRCEWPLMHYPQTSLIYFYFEFWVAYATMCIATRVYLAYTSSLWENHVSYTHFLY